MAQYLPATKSSGLLFPSSTDPYQPSAGIKYAPGEVLSLTAVGGIAFSAGFNVGSLVVDLVQRARGK